MHFSRCFSRPCFARPLSHRLCLPALAVLALLGLMARPASAQTFTFATTGYNSPTFVDSLGSYSFSVNANSSAFTATNVPTTISLDAGGSALFNGGAKNAAAPTVFTGTASSQITITGLGTQTFTQNYTLDGTTPGVKFPSFQSGPSLSFLLAGGTQQLVLTPIASSGFSLRQATVQVVPLAVTPAPEPSTSAALGMGMIGLTGLAFKARRRKAV